MEAKKKSNHTLVKKELIYLSILLTLLISFPVGYALGGLNTNNEQSAESTDQSLEEKSEPEPYHSHDLYEVTDLENAPSITMLDITKDSKSGWNLSLVTENFTFAPDKAGMGHIDNTGHAHLYIDGVKVSRLYGSYYHIEELEEGQNEIMVTLNTNDHKDYSVGGSVVMASRQINTISSDSTIDDHHHETDEPHEH